jgi:thiol-disulfide isomerase/thioredoxin
MTRSILVRARPSSHLRAARLALGAVALVVGVGCGSPAPPGASPSAPSGSAQPIELTLVSNDGTPRSLPFAGSATVIDYFAPNCEPCRAKLPALVARRAELEQRGAHLVLVGVLESSDSTEAVEKVLSSWGLPGERFFIDRDGVSAKVAKVTDFPTTQVFDAGRSLRWVGHVGATADDVVKAVAALP